MADLKKWFKVWTVILDDPHFQELPLQQIGRWALLGAMLASVGTRGTLRSPASARRLLEVLRCDTLDDLKLALKHMPNVSFTSGENAGGGDYGEFVVSMEKWRKYQEDYSVAARVQRLRSKKRREEKIYKSSPRVTEQTPLQGPKTDPGDDTKSRTPTDPMTPTDEDRTRIANEARALADRFTSAAARDVPTEPAPPNPQGYKA